MGTSTKRGAPPQFPYTLEEFHEIFERYKQKYYAGELKKPFWPDFLAENEISLEAAKATIKEPVASNRVLSEELKKALEWCTAKLMVADEWTKPQTSSKSMFGLKQDFGIGGYTDRQDINASGKVDIQVRFGSKCKDPFR